MNRFLRNTVFFLSLAGSFAAYTQELVPNGDFEAYAICPDLDSGYFLQGCAVGWFSPGISSPDYFNTCSEQLDAYGQTSMSVPLNGRGYQEAHSGQAYAGMINGMFPNGFGHYEYMSVKLLEPLEAGRYYHVEYYVSLADSIWWDSDVPYLQYYDVFGAAVSVESPEQLYAGVPTSALYTWPVQVQSPSGVFFSDSLGWQKFEGVFAASGDETYMTIGCFAKWADAQANYYHAQDSFIETYYFIDDVSLVPLDSFAVKPLAAVEIPNVFTPDGDGINDLFTAGLPPQEGSVAILNRWGQTVFTSGIPFAWDGTSNGVPCSEGVYFYVINAGEEIKSGMVQLLGK